MLVFISLVGCVLSLKATSTAQLNLDKILSKGDLTLVYFYSQKAPSSKRHINIFHTLANQFDNQIKFAIADVDHNKTLTSFYKLAQPPQILVFRKFQPITAYTGEISSKALTDYCESIVNAAYTTLETDFEVLEFETAHPNTIVVPEDTEIPRGISLLADIGVRTQSDKVQIRQIYENQTTSLETAEWDTIEKMLIPKYQQLDNQDNLANTHESRTFIAILDTKDYLQQIKVHRVFDKIKETFSEGMDFQKCDFFTCTKVVNQLGVLRFSNPIFMVTTRQKADTSIDLYQKPTQSPDELLSWAKLMFLGERPTSDRKEIEIPYLKATDFVNIVLDPKIDVILFVSDRSMPKYEFARSNVEKLIELFSEIQTVKILEYNPRLEPVEGLQMPLNGGPQLSVWPGKAEPDGSLFQADLPLPVILENLIQMLASEVTEDQVSRMAQKLEQMVY